MVESLRSLQDNMSYAAFNNSHVDHTSGADEDQVEEPAIGAYTQIDEPKHGEADDQILHARRVGSRRFRLEIG